MSAAVYKVPFPPYKDVPINPYNKLNNGTNYGLLDPNGASVDHSMYGLLWSTDAWFRMRSVGSLTPWGIGGTADGSSDGLILRWMDYYAYEGIQPWSSGPWVPPGYGDGGAFVAKYGVAGINGIAQAIETSDGGSRQYPMSRKQWISLIWLKAAIAHQGGITSDEIRELLAFMHHREFTTPREKDCPFPRIYNYTEEYLGAVETLMAFFEGKITDINKLIFMVAGMSLDMRHVGRLKGGVVTPTPELPKTEPAPVEKPAADGWVKGKSIRAKKEVLSREGPGTSFPFGMVIDAGDFVKLVDGVIKSANGMDWVDVVSVGGTGWVPMQDFELASKETTSPGPVFQDFTPNRTFTIGPGGATLRQWGNTSSVIIDHLSPGEKFEADGYYFGEEVDGENEWLVQNDDPRGRIHISGVVEDI